MDASAALQRLIDQARADPAVLAVILFGSAARKEPSPSDVDVCLVLKGAGDRAAATTMRLRYGSHEHLDLHVFQALPLPIRHRVLKEGNILLCNDEDALYALAASTMREYTYFRPAYETYLEGVRAGS